MVCNTNSPKQKSEGSTELKVMFKISSRYFCDYKAMYQRKYTPRTVSLFGGFWISGSYREETKYHFVATAFSFLILLFHSQSVGGEGNKSKHVMKY